MIGKVVLAGLALGLIGCVLLNNTAMAGPQQCIPGQSIACACVNGANGAQTCLDNGSFAACVCAGQEVVPEKDCSGRWNLGQEDNVLLVRGGAGRYEIRNGEEGYGGPWYSKVTVTVTRDGCRFRYYRTEGMGGYNTEASYDLIESRGMITGKAVVKNENSEGAVRTDSYPVSGRLVPIKTTDISFNSDSVKSDFSRFVETMKESCESIPPSLLRPGTVVSARVVVGKSGGIAKLFLNGIDMRVQERCTTHISENKSRFFPNYSGREQSVTFTYAMQ